MIVMAPQDYILLPHKNLTQDEIINRAVFKYCANAFNDTPRNTAELDPCTYIMSKDEWYQDAVDRGLKCSYYDFYLRSCMTNLNKFLDLPSPLGGTNRDHPWDMQKLDEWMRDYTAEHRKTTAVIPEEIIIQCPSLSATFTPSCGYPPYEISTNHPDATIEGNTIKLKKNENPNHEDTAYLSIEYEPCKLVQLEWPWWAGYCATNIKLWYCDGSLQAEGGTLYTRYYFMDSDPEQAMAKCHELCHDKATKIINNNGYDWGINDVRTQKMIDEGCYPCAVQSGGYTITAHDSEGNEGSAILNVKY